MSVGYFAVGIADIGLVPQILRTHTLSKLIVEIVGNVHATIKPTDVFCQKLSKVYMLAASIQRSTDVRINIESLKGRKRVNLKVNPDVIFVKDGSPNYHHSVPVVKVAYNEASSADEQEPNLVDMYANVILGGTFDRLHVGHKILLTEAAIRCTNKMTVGVTDDSMIKNKKLFELIEPVETRIRNIKDFLQDTDGNISYDVVPISDMFGPTQTDPDLDLLVVSEETYKGGLKVNEVRELKKFKKLALHTVNLVELGEKGEADEEKVSSSNQRLRLLGTRLRSPAPKASVPEQPYLIGLTGGIASGKSNVARVLASKGAGLVDCDKVAHRLYEKGSSIQQQIVEMFGPSVLADSGEIDRRALGALVFSDKDQLEKLNKLMWPAILEKSLEEADRLYNAEGKTIVVLEAAVLLRAGWHQAVHEVWTCIIPPAEAVQRVVNRNKISEKEAQARLEAQPSNVEQVAIATVVFCSLYSYDYTQGQVDRAWELLQQFLSCRKSLNKASL